MAEALERSIDMESLHTDILQNILFRLSFKEALYVRRVCKTWKALLADRCCNKTGFLFAYIELLNSETNICYGEELYDHLIDDDNGRVNKMNYYYTRETLARSQHESFSHLICYAATVIVGSCNGLVCFKRSKHDDPFLITNPFTGESAFLPNIDCTSFETRSLIRNQYRVLCGFGYCHSTNDYKVVTICYDDQVRDEGQVQVLTIGSDDEWRNLGYTSYELGSWSSLCSASGVFVNGAIHWLDEKIDLVVAFDLEDEKFQLLPLPPLEEPALDRVLDPENMITLLGGNLCLAHYNNDDYFVDIWAYKQNNGNSNNPEYYNSDAWSWVKEFHVEYGEGAWYKPFAITGSNLLLMWNQSNILHCYDPKTSTIHEIWDSINVMAIAFIEAVPYTTGCVSLKDHIEEKRVQMIAVDDNVEFSSRSKNSLAKSLTSSLGYL